MAVDLTATSGGADGRTRTLVTLNPLKLAVRITVRRAGTLDRTANGPDTAKIYSRRTSCAGLSSRSAMNFV